MKPFLHRHTLHLTPLSPLHLGTGEDYEPTNYVIKDGLLYAFEPAQADLPVERLEILMQIARIGDLQKIQKFFIDHSAPFRKAAYHVCPVSKGIEEEYKKKIGNPVAEENKRSQVFNRFQIEKSAFHPHMHTAYIPGSAIKGGLRTAVLEVLSKTKTGFSFDRSYKKKEEEVAIEIAQSLEQELLDGDYSSDFMRLYKVSDLTVGETTRPLTQILYAINHEKDEEEAADGGTIAVRRDAVLHAQYRAFSGSLTSQDLVLQHEYHVEEENKLIPEKNRITDLTKIVQYSMDYHLDRFRKEAKILKDRKLIDSAWLESTNQLIENLLSMMKEGKILLMRLGKNGGAENKTLKGFAHIKSKIDKNRDEYLQESTTIWLAGEQERSKHNLLPFGWVLIEIDPQGDNSAIRQWCENNDKHLQILRTKIMRQQALAEQEKQQAAERAARAAAAEAEAARIAALPYWEKNLHDWQETAKELTETKKGAGDQQTQNLIKTIAEGLQTILDDPGIDAPTRTTIAETIRNLFPKNSPLLSEKKRKEQINPLLHQLQGK